MEKREAKKKIITYLDDHRMAYELINENGIVFPENRDSIYLSCELPMLFSGKIETIIRLEETSLYAQSYFANPVIKTDEEKLKAALMLSFMNHNLWWDSNDLINHVYGMVEDEGDVYNRLRIRYVLLEHFFQECMNHIFSYSVQQIAEIGQAFLNGISGIYSYKEFQDYLKENVMGKRR